MSHRFLQLHLRATPTAVALCLGLVMVACGEKVAEPQAPAAEPVSSRKIPANPESGTPESLREGVPRNLAVRRDWVNLREQPSLTAHVLTTVSIGTVVENLGCSLVEGRDWCDVQLLGGGPRGYIAADLLEPPKAGNGDVDTTGTISCAMTQDQPMGECPFVVRRADGGTAKVVATRPDGSERTLYFLMGRAIAADTTEAGDSGNFWASKIQDAYTIHVGDERYQLTEAVVFGS